MMLITKNARNNEGQVFNSTWMSGEAPVAAHLQYHSDINVEMTQKCNLTRGKETFNPSILGAPSSPNYWLLTII